MGKHSRMEKSMNFLSQRLMIVYYVRSGPIGHMSRAPEVWV